MRRLFIIVVAATTFMVSGWAMAGNQETAELIARNIKGCGQLQNFNVGVKYQDGTAWLRGRVNSQDQMNAAMQVVFKTKGVNRVVNDLTISSADSVRLAPPAGRTKKKATRSMKAQYAGAIAPERLSWRATAPQPKQTASLSSASRQIQRAIARMIPFAADKNVRQVSANVPMQQPRPMPRQVARPMNRPVPVAYMQNAGYAHGRPMAMGAAYGQNASVSQYDQPNMPNYAWPSYAAHPNYAAVTCPKQYSPTAWPYIGPFYPYPQVPLGWRKVTLEWDDGWWMLDFKD